MKLKFFWLLVVIFSGSVHAELYNQNLSKFDHSRLEREVDRLHKALFVDKSAPLLKSEKKEINNLKFIVDSWGYTQNGVGLNVTYAQGDTWHSFGGVYDCTITVDEIFRVHPLGWIDLDDEDEQKTCVRAYVHLTNLLSPPMRKAMDEMYVKLFKKPSAPISDLMLTEWNLPYRGYAWNGAKILACSIKDIVVSKVFDENGEINHSTLLMPNVLTKDGKDEGLGGGMLKFDILLFFEKVFL